MIRLAIEDITRRHFTKWRLPEQHRELERSNTARDAFASVRIGSMGAIRRLRRCHGCGLVRDDRPALRHDFTRAPSTRQRTPTAAMAPPIQVNIGSGTAAEA